MGISHSIEKQLVPPSFTEMRKTYIKKGRIYHILRATQPPITQFNDMYHHLSADVDVHSQKVFAEVYLETCSPTSHFNVSFFFLKAFKKNFFHRGCSLQEYWHVALLIKRYTHFKDTHPFFHIKLYGRTQGLVDGFGYYTNGKVTTPHLTSALPITINKRETERIK